MVPIDRESGDRACATTAEGTGANRRMSPVGVADGRAVTIVLRLVGPVPVVLPGIPDTGRPATGGAVSRDACRESIQKTTEIRESGRTPCRVASGCPPGASGAS